MNPNYHIPVLRTQSVEALVLNPDGIYVDATFGGGGHSSEILSRLSSKGQLFAFDQDVDAVNNQIADERFTLIQANFRFIQRFLRFHKVKQVDGILADFGVSSHQFDVPDRGFSTRYDAVLDMRMNQTDDLDAKQLINTYEEQDLIRIFRTYGELKMAPKLARVIVNHRAGEIIKTTSQLNSILEPLLPKTKVFKFLAQIYQAIRIEVNQEMKALEEFLLQTQELVKQGGRLSFITYHSLEDRLVKRYIRDGNFQGQAQKDFYGNKLVPFKKVGRLVVPDQTEIDQNSRARSAKLRIAEKL
jgi:16S rRNA (cytosine1402-N4)-methyltransferase